MASNRGSFKFNWHDELFVRDIIKNSISQSEALRKMGLSPESSAVTFRKYVKRYDIDTSHFNQFRQLIERKELKEYLVENSTHRSRWALRKRLLSEKILPYKCGGCENEGLWRGKKMSLHLEHKNGINNDNRIENLEFLCPNCHSLTDTYAGKNKNVS